VVCPLSRIHTLGTDSGAPSSALDMLRDNGVQVVVVEADDEANAAA
jgi:DeoR family transcriptional regulator, ulaG and ulaABCDEF operon transcriptional repressor